MKLKVPSPDTMDKVILVVAVIGIIIAFVTVKNIPTPEEHYHSVETALNKMLVLQNKTNDAISKQDYYTACLAQQEVVDLALQNNVGDLGIDIDNLLRLEELVCDVTQQELI
jgi:hypothetical protein